MHIARRILALCLVLLIQMITSAQAEVPFLVHSNEWDWDTPAEVLLKADVETHMPYDDDRLAMLKPIIDMLQFRIVTGHDDGLVSIWMADQELLTLQYHDNQAQLSSLPEITFQAETDPIDILLGNEASVGNAFELLHLAPEGETLITDGYVLLQEIPSAFEKYGKRSVNTTNISGYGTAAYRYDYTINANKAGEVKDGLMSICPDGWLKEIIGSLTFSGKQTLRMYYTADDTVLRVEYNGGCGPENDLRTVKLVYKMRHDDEQKKDYIELTSPAKKGTNKNNLTFERMIGKNKSGAQAITGSFNYTVNKDSVLSIRKSSFSLTNDYTGSSDILGGEATFEYRLNGAEKYTALNLSPAITITGTEDAPVITGTLTVTEKYANKVTEHAVISIDANPAPALLWTERSQLVDLSALDAEKMIEVQRNVAQSIVTAIVRPLVLDLEANAEWFFRDIPAESIQTIVDAAGAAQ